MIQFFDAFDMYNYAGSLIKSDLFNALLSKKLINIGNNTVIGLDDKAGILRIIKNLKNNKAEGIWINRNNQNGMKSSLYDHQVSSLSEFLSIIKKQKKKPFLLLDFDNTLFNVKYEKKRDNFLESNFWINMKNKRYGRFLAFISSRLTSLNILTDKIFKSLTPYDDTKDLFSFIKKNNIPTMIISYRHKSLMQKYIDEL